MELDEMNEQPKLFYENINYCGEIDTYYFAFSWIFPEKESLSAAYYHKPGGKSSTISSQTLNKLEENMKQKDFGETIDEIARRMNEGECVHQLNKELFLGERKDYDCGPCLGHEYSCDLYKNSAELPFVEFVKIAVNQVQEKVYRTKGE